VIVWGDAGQGWVDLLCLKDSHHEPAIMGGRCAQKTRPISEEEVIRLLGFGSIRAERG